MRIRETNAVWYTFAFVIVAAVAVCWWLTIAMAADFRHSPQTRALWQNASFGPLFAMWGVMMMAMMLPAGLPLFKLFYRYETARGAAIMVSGIFLTAGFLLPWLVFSAAAAAMQAAASHAGIFADDAFFADAGWRAAFLFAAGVYQFMPLKYACLRRCQNPVFFLLICGRHGAFGAGIMGAAYGVYCVGCCWALMLLLFVGGVMDLRWIVLLAAFALIEKIVPLPPRLLAYMVGAILLTLAVVELLPG